MAATAGLLSCDPEYTIRLTGPGGSPILAEFDTQAVEGQLTRALDATADASVSILIASSAGRQACGALTSGRVQGWGCAELEIWRDGNLAFAGPIITSDQAYGELHIKAQDYSVWWRRRTLPDMVFRGVDIATIFAQVHLAAMADDPVPGFTVDSTATGIIADRTIVGTDDDYAIKHIDELSRTGLDWTAYGRTLLTGGQTITAAPITTLTDDDWTGEGPRIQFAGDRYATKVVLHGAGSLRSVASIATPCGLVVRVFSEETIEDQASLDTAAVSRLAVVSNPWRLVTPENGSLRCGAPVEFARLIPGARVRIATEVMCEPVVADFRLVGVAARLDDPGVQISLAPLGASGFTADTAENPGF